MARRAAGANLLAMQLDRTSRVPLYRQLFAALRDAILGGSLDGGSRLPASRTLATELGISRNTVLQAFELLTDEGFLVGLHGSGTYVSDAVAQPLEGDGAGAPSTSTVPATLSARGRAWVASSPVPTVEGGRPFALGEPAFDRFPHTTWRRLMAANLAASAAALGYGDQRGSRRLRQALAGYLATARGVRCQGEQIVVFASAQQALTLAANLLLDAGEAAWIEEPGYLGARAALQAAAATVVPVPVDQEGLDVAAGRRLAPTARLAYVTPSHQHPLGRSLSLRQRLALVAWARDAGAWIVEDDYDSEFRFAGRPLTALQGLAPERVIYVGTFSKVLYPALRLAYAVLPEALCEPFLAARRLGDAHPATLLQETVADFIERGHFTTHVRRMLAVYRRRKDALTSVLESADDVLEVVPSSTGLHLAVRLTGALADTEVCRRAAARGLSAAPLSRSYLGPPQQGLVLGYGSTPAAELAPAADRLVDLLRS